MDEKLYQKIIVATDGTDYVKKAINTAISLSKLTGAELYAVYVADVSNITPTSAEWVLVSENIKKESDAALEYFKAEAEKAGIQYQTISLSGSAPGEIVQYANQINADLIIVGATGKKALERMLLGSVSEKIVRTAKQQVLIVRYDAAENKS
ncbi:putative universal stress protein [Methanosarcinaceae archaeon Ag5]|uniref:Universal stress protein n=1 Tax=Methanolapillus africanus TaxID=3028297 RepID=A0AAE4MJ70_9EURY|nr:putative universal stress protein [Methanosarcinaceae archaeon Ag5]